MRLSDVPLDQALIDRLQVSFLRLLREPQGFADLFYERLFGLHPGLRSMFSADVEARPRKLTEALQLVVNSLRAPAVARKQLEELGRRHAGFGVVPAQYTVVCDILVQAFADILGADWTPDLAHDWAVALRLVSEIMLEGANAPPP